MPHPSPQPPVTLGALDDPARVSRGLPLTDGRPGATHVLTVGHGFLPGGAVAVGVFREGRGRRIGRRVLDLLDEGLDAAVIALDGALPPEGWPDPPVRAVGAPGRRVCRPRGTALGWKRVPFASFRCPRRGLGYVVRDGIRVVPGRTVPGESGLLLRRAEDPAVAVGMLVGVCEGASIYLPLVPLVEEVGARLGVSLAVATSAARAEKSSFST